MRRRCRPVRRGLGIAALTLLLLVSGCGDEEEDQPSDDAAPAVDGDEMREMAHEALENENVREMARDYAKEHPEAAEKAKKWLAGDDDALEGGGAAGGPVGDGGGSHWMDGPGGGVPWWFYPIFGLAGLVVLMCVIDLGLRLRRLLRQSRRRYRSY